MTEILVTGSYGQLGNELNLLARDFDSYSFVFTDVDSLDITSSPAISEFFNRHQFSYVVNCAAYTAVDKAESDRTTAAMVNSLAPGLLAANSLATGARMIHISTDYVFDGKSNVPYKETDQVNPVNFYGQTKLDGEYACLENNPESIIIRTSWLYSSFGKNFVKTIRRIANEGKPFKVVFDQTGTPTYAADLAQVILGIIKSAEDNTAKFVPGIYHYSNEGVCSWYDFALAVLEFSGIGCRIDPVETSEFPTPAKRPVYSVLNKAKIRNTFGIEIPYWRTSLLNCMEKINKENENGKQ